LVLRSYRDKKVVSVFVRFVRRFTPILSMFYGATKRAGELATLAVECLKCFSLRTQVSLTIFVKR
jgi:hypothetical protein